MALTIKEIRSATPRKSRYRLSDGGGLVLDVTPAGKKTWRFRYQRDGKDAVVTLGHFPDLSLLDARAVAVEMRREKEQGADPSLQAKREAARQRLAHGKTFADMATALMERERGFWADAHLERFRHRMEKDVFPAIGDLPVADVQPADVLRAIQPIETRGAQNTAIRVVGMIGQVLQFAVAKGHAAQDVTLHMKRGLDRAPRPVHRAAVLDREELGQLLADIWDWPDETLGKPILQLCALTFQRPGEVRSMLWKDVDFDRALWSFHVSKVGVDHAVPLAPQAVEILQTLQAGTGRYEHVFASPRAKSGVVSAVVPMKLLEKLRWRDKQSAHGFRAVARTLIAEDLQVAPALIERQLSHTVPETHGRAYNRTLHLPERREMMERYADLLDRLRRHASSPVSTELRVVS